MGKYYLVQAQKRIKLSKSFASKGEGTVYRVIDTNLVFKKFHQILDERTHKLLAMIRNPPTDLIYCGSEVQVAWALDLVQNERRKVVGYVMPYISHSTTLYHFIHSGLRLEEFKGIATYKNVVNVARNLCGLFHRIHKTKRLVIGDINSENFHVDLQRGLVSALDTDSWQVKTKKKTFLCNVYSPDCSPPEMFKRGALKRPRTKYQDRFGLAVLVYQALLDSHPYHGVYNGGDLPPTIPDRIKKNNLPYSRYDTHSATQANWFQRILSPAATLREYTPPPTAFPLETLSDELRELFFRAFFYGHSDPRARPSAGELFDALDCYQRELDICDFNRNHLYWEGLDACPWCRHRDRHQFDPFPLEK